MPQMPFHGPSRVSRTAVIVCIAFIFLASLNFHLSRDIDVCPAELQLPKTLHEPYQLLARKLFESLEDDVRRHYDPSVLDYLEIKPYAQTFSMLWDMYLEKNQLPSSPDESLRQTLSNIGGILYPWLTAGSSKTFMEFIETTFTGERGIVITSGRQQFRVCMHLVYSLRHVHKTTLPIEIMYAGDEDLTVDERNFLGNAGSDIRFVDVKKILTDPENLIELPGSFAIKAFALLVSSFKEAMLIDADGILLKDPLVFFEQNGYKETGTLFFHDREFSGTTDESIDLVKSWLKNTKYYDEILKDSLYFAHKTGHEMESGVVVIDKVRTLSGLLLACHMNLKKQREKLTTKHFYGDKETFWLGFGISETRFRFVEGYAGGIGRYRKDYPSFICTLQLLHVDENGEPMWMNNSLLEFKLANQDKYARFEAWGYGAEPAVWVADSDCQNFNEFRYGAVGKDLTPVSPELKQLLDKMINLAKDLDIRATKANLITVIHKE